MHVCQQTVTSQWRFTVFPIVFPVELGCFHLFYPITKLLKIFAWNLHTLLRIDYISTCVIHFKCTLLLEDIISWHVGDGFYGPLCTCITQMHVCSTSFLRHPVERQSAVLRKTINRPTWSTKHCHRHTLTQRNSEQPTASNSSHNNTDSVTTGLTPHSSI